MERGEHDPREAATSPAFDLEPALERWRAELVAEGVPLTALAELEDHVHAQHERLTELGLPGDEAWHLARRRLGTARALAREYAKLETSLPPSLVWIAIGYLVLSDASALLYVSSSAVYELTHRTGPTLAVLAAGFVGLFAVVARWGLRWLAHPTRSFALLSGLWCALLVARLAFPPWNIPRAMLLETRSFDLPLLSVGGLFPFVAVVGAAGILVQSRLRRRSTAGS